MRAPANTDLRLRIQEAGVAERGSGATRDEEVENLLLNHAIVFMALFEEAIADIGDRMAETHQLPEAARAYLSEVISDIREEAAAQWPKDRRDLSRYIADPVFDEGVELVRRYDLGRPRLTEALDDMALVSYALLLKGGDAEATRLFRELQEWKGRLPRPSARA